MKNLRHIWQTVIETISNNFKSATLTFLLIMLVVNGFQVLFGSENMVLGIIIAPMMLVLMARDMTAHPVKNFARQAIILCAMAAAACFSTLVPFPVALLIHLLVVFVISYAYTSDCGDHMYFQYILNYLFLIFIGPISLPQLPMRLLGMVAGAGCILLYQYIKGRGRIEMRTREVLLSLLDDTKVQIDSLVCGRAQPHDNATLYNALKTFNQTVEHRRKSTLGLSEASIVAVEIVHSLEKLHTVLCSSGSTVDEEKLMLLRNMLVWIDHVRAFVTGEREDIPQYQNELLGDQTCDAQRFYQWTVHLQMAFSAMLCPIKRRSFRKTGISVWARLKLAINFSPMRIAYALRLSCLLAVGILLVQHFNLAHGKWMLFTIASVSLPYSDEVGTKAKNRFLATLIGGAVSFIIFPLIPSATGKMAAMIASGYLSCYMPDYLRNFSCATVGALGGAIFAMSSTGFGPVSGMVLTRIIYITVGIVIAIAFNCIVFPMNREKATRCLAQKYIQVTRAISESYRNQQSDLQLHYHLILRMHQLEDKLRQNAKALQWEDVHVFLRNHQMDIRQAQETYAFTASILA